MSYEIKIKGRRDPVTMGNSILVNGIKKSWEEYLTGKGDNLLVTLGKWTGTLSKIDDFLEIGSANSETSDDQWNNSYSEFLKRRGLLVKLSPEEKSKKIDFFRLMYYGFTNQKSEDVTISGIPIEDKVQKIQLKFFIENPNRTICDPHLFKPLIKSKTSQASILRIIEGAALHDMKLSK